MSCHKKQDLSSGQDFDKFLQDYDSCMKISEQASPDACLKNLSKANLPQVWKAFIFAQIQIRKHNQLEAIQIINEALPLTEGQYQFRERAMLLELRSSIHFKHNDRQQGADDLYEAIDIFLSLKKHREAAHGLVEIANLQFNSENYDLARENAGKAIEHYKLVENLTRTDSVYMMNCYNTLALSDLKLNNSKSAAHNYKSALAIATRLHEEFWIALINGNSAHIDAEEGRINDAIQKLNTDIRISLKFNEIKSAAASYLTVGEIYKKANNLSLAKVYYDSSLYILTQHKIPEIDPRYFKLLSEWHEANHNKSEAYRFLTQYLTLRDSIVVIKNSLLLQQLQTKRVFQKQLEDINLLATKNKLKEEELRIREVSIIAFLMIMLLLLLLVFNIRRSNAALRNLNNSLEMKVKQRMASILKLNKELDTYLYRASHDIRGPILSIQGLVYLFNFTKNPEEIRDLVNKIDHTAKGMDSMLLKLQMAYELNIRHEYEEVNIYDLLTSVLTSIKDKFPDVKSELNGNKDLIVYTNLYHLSVATHNIIENACIFRNSSVDVNKVHIDFLLLADTLKIQIEDNGIGIHTVHLEKIFEAFQRFSTLSIGNGMGLYIAHKAIHNINGSIKVTSQLEKGSVFTIEIPVKNR